MKKPKLLGLLTKTLRISRSPLWFLVGFTISGLTMLSIVIIIFQDKYAERTIPGIFIENIYVGEKTKDEIRYIYQEKNKNIGNSKFTFSYGDITLSSTATDLGIGYDSNLMAEQALGLGKSSNFLSNFFIITNAYLNGIDLNSSFTFDKEKLSEVIKPLKEIAYKEPVNAEFEIENDRVVKFNQSQDGQKLDEEKVSDFVLARIPSIIHSKQQKEYQLVLPTVSLKPEITTEEANSYGIVEKIGEGVSYFTGSIQNRIFNIGHGASKIDGTLVKPGEEFSFNAHIGDISRLTGYKEAYVISGGRTVLGDGGGVCQVSTTLFRAILNAGVPIAERNAHSYRVSYYEQNSPPGIDATIYVPSVDLKFLNDTKNYILIKANFNEEERSLTFSLYGKNDGRTVNLSEPVILSRSPAPEPLYEEDPSLPIGVTKQVDYAAGGAFVQFKRTVTKNGAVMIDETFSSRYSPWQAVFKVGTKQG